uniref:Uncharacterized protein n=1 Tax=Tanacetum cinerariifolium TaxID=118510 RepID=A0A699GRJ9_TANCI|nr:hypothetical protein [Tanacetum cinerariifolium]
MIVNLLNLSCFPKNHLTTNKNKSILTIHTNLITTKDKQPVDNEDKTDDWYYELKAELQREWKQEDEQHAILAGKAAKEDLKEEPSLTKYDDESDYEPEDEAEYESDEDSRECFDYDDLHLAYSREKSPKWNF